MAHEKLSPRQKMIGMMYLVLTAMLALNVSKEAVEAFKKVDNGLTRTIANYVKKNNLIYEDFDRADAENPKKAGPWKTKAYLVKQRADEAFDYIQDLKIEIITTAEGPESLAVSGREVIIEEVKRIDDTNVPSQILIGADEGGKANDLKALLEDYRTFLIDEILAGKSVTSETAVRSMINTDPVYNSKTKEDERWENGTFQTLPLVAVITILSKIQLDVRNAETEVLNYLYTQIDAASFKFNKLVPTVITNSNYIMAGNDYNAEVFIAATDTTRAPEYRIGTYKTTINADGTPTYEMVGDYTTLPIDERGRGLFTQRASSTGDKKWSGLINLKAPDGTDVFYPFDATYTVAAPNVVVSPTAMNVLYQGIDNPIDISVPGVGSDKLRPTMVNGEIKAGKVMNARTKENYPGSFIANPTTVGQDAQIVVSAEVNGKQMKFPPYIFRVRSLPNPIAKFAGLTDGNVDKNVALAQPIVQAVLENFEFDLVYTVTAFTLSINEKGFDIEEASTSNRLTDAQKALINRLTRGKKLIFSGIKAVGPDKKTRDLPAVILKIN
jgi:gliding motility-associated protein GldM